MSTYKTEVLEDDIHELSDNIKEFLDYGVNDKIDLGRMGHSIGKADARTLCGTITGEPAFVATTSDTDQGIQTEGCWVNLPGGMRNIQDREGVLTPSTLPAHVSFRCNMGGGYIVDLMVNDGLLSNPHPEVVVARVLPLVANLALMERRITLVKLLDGAFEWGARIELLDLIATVVGYTFENLYDTTTHGEVDQHTVEYLQPPKSLEIEGNVAHGLFPYREMTMGLAGTTAKQLFGQDETKSRGHFSQENIDNLPEGKIEPIDPFSTLCLTLLVHRAQQAKLDKLSRMPASNHPAETSFRIVENPRWFEKLKPDGGAYPSGPKDQEERG